jgi:hypothetical protein
LLPAGAFAGWGLHPLEKRRLLTAHANSRHCVRPGDKNETLYPIAMLKTSPAVTLDGSKQ